MSIDSLTARSASSGAVTMRPPVAGTTHMVSAGHYLASQAAFQVLETGGNAVDAGVAAGIALGVLQSDFVNFAGVAPIMIYLAATRQVVTIDGLGVWPARASLRFFLDECGGTIPRGLLRTVVPAAPDAWITALARYGTRSFGEVASAAIRFARDGFPMHALMASNIATYQEDLRRWPSNAAVYLPNGCPPGEGELFVQADLARTLQYMADEESAASRVSREAGLRAARAAFYAGDIAATIAGYHRENGGLLTVNDLAVFKCRLEAPLSMSFRGSTVYACGPWCQGPSLLQMLAIADGLPLEELGHNAPAYIHALSETIKLAFADREALIGDPRFVTVPIDAMLSPDYAAKRRRMIDPDAAFPGLPPCGLTEAEGPGLAAESHSETVGASLDTSYVAVVDRYGNAFSATPSDVSIDTPVIPGLGICPSSRGSQSWADERHPSRIAPGKRPRLTPNPALAIRTDGSLIPFGTPGGDVQCQAMLQVLINLAVFGMNVQQSIEAPRFATFSAPDSFEPHGFDSGRLMLERSLAEEVGEPLGALGHQIGEWPELSWRAGGVCMVNADRTTGIVTGGADPRRPSYAIGW